MSVADQLTSDEKKILTRWYPYSQKWGYFCDTTGRNYEDDIHDTEFYQHVTSVSDNVFRNLVKWHDDKAVFRSDISGKAEQTSLLLDADDLKRLCKSTCPQK